MKKFFTNIPLQIEGDLDRYVYIPVGNSRLKMEEATSFPIVPAISGYVERGETFRLIAVVPNSDVGERNCAALETELKTLCRERGIVCPEGVERIPGPSNQKVDSHISTLCQQNHEIPSKKSNDSGYDNDSYGGGQSENPGFPYGYGTGG